MINKLLFCFIASTFLFTAQNLGAQDFITNKCWTVEYEQYLEDNYPNERSTKPEFEDWISQEVNDIDESAQRATLWTVPIVFHLLHNGNPVGNGGNLSAAIVQAQIDQLNLDFANLSGATDPAAGDSQIQFCAATLDPSGNCMPEPGINRITNSTAGLNGWPHSTTYIENTIKAATQWLPSQYVNVWVTNIASTGGGQILGYAQFPNQSGLAGLGANNGAGNTDGVVVDYRSVGSLANTGPWGNTNGAGRTLTHELGHFFGLRHIWGDGGCGIDDFCADTPTSDAANGGCNTNHVSCGTTDMVRNYMDYTNDNCMNIYTQDQADRMFVVMGGNGAGTGSPRRESLATSPACNACNAACGNMISLTGNQSGTFDQESGDWIVSTQSIQAGANVDYDGTTYVQLDPNFCTPASSNFNAFIDGCNGGAGGINLTDSSDESSIKSVTQGLIQKVKEMLFGQ